MHMLYNADVLVTAHGFQSMLLLFLPLPALLFEIFPYKYYSRDNVLLASEYGERFQRDFVEIIFDDWYDVTMMIKLSMYWV